jgi:hypothetical protein
MALSADVYPNRIIAEAFGKTILGSVSYERHFGRRIDSREYRPWHKSWEVGVGAGVGKYPQCERANKVLSSEAIAFNNRAT